jgi:hypothetical protein
LSPGFLCSKSVLVISTNTPLKAHTSINVPITIYTTKYNQNTKAIEDHI